MPELPPVTMAFWPLSTLLIGQAGITGSGNCSSMNFRSGMCIRPTGIIAWVGFSKSVSFEFMGPFDMVFVAEFGLSFLHWSRGQSVPYNSSSNSFGEETYAACANSRTIPCQCQLKWLGPLRQQ